MAMSRRAGASERSAVAVAVAGAVFLLFAVVMPRPALAQITQTGTTERASSPEMNVRTDRSGLVVEVLVGAGVAGASGYPNNSDQIGDPNYYSSSNLLVGTGSALFVGGAFADYLNFGVWLGSQKFHSKDWRSTGGGGGFRLEVFPLFVLVPSLKNLGLEAQFGIGGASLQAQGGNYPEASGTQSFLGIGAFYEIPLFKALGGHGTIGPSFEYDNIFTQSVDRGSSLLGVRLAFYGGM
jgi:hypothetical protein